METHLNYGCPTGCDRNNASGEVPQWTWNCASSKGGVATTKLKTRPDGQLYWVPGEGTKLYQCNKQGDISGDGWYCNEVALTYEGVQVYDSYAAPSCVLGVDSDGSGGGGQVPDPDQPNPPVIDPTTDPCECDDTPSCVIC